MTSRNDLLARPVVLDASVLINLVVVADPGAILRALCQPQIVNIAAREVRRNPRNGTRGDAVLGPLIQSRLLSLVEMDEEESQLFVDLVSSPSPDDLDDGEAATLACATRRNLVPLIDERKAHRVLRERFPDTRGRSTIGIYQRLLADGVFRPDYIRVCVYDSLRYARMRVVPGDLGWVTDLLRPEQLANCPSISPRYRGR